MMLRLRLKNRSVARTIAMGAIVASGVLGSHAVAGATDTAPTLAPIPGGVTAPPGSQLAGALPASMPLSVSVVMQPNNSAQLQTLETSLYDPSSSSYHQWLSTGQFDARFAPTAQQTAAVTAYLKSQGLQLQPASTPFLVRASGTARQVQTAFDTSIQNYTTTNGTRFFTTSTPVSVPASLKSTVAGVIGLSNLHREHSHIIHLAAAAKKRGSTVPNYGGAPDGGGLTPSQLSGLYDANGIHNTGAAGQGAGKTLAVFELSGYTQSDIPVFEHQFFGASENVPLVNIYVDGGPITPVCPRADFCVPGPDYSGDDEVEADIETQIAMAPKISKLLVYDAPNDYTGQTSIDEYFRIAHDNLADSISTSWGLCEPDNGFPEAVAENTAFTEMALQGQSIFAASGDAGAYDCFGNGGPNDDNPAVDDPASQPLVTGAGGTSFEDYDPGSNPNPSYPASGETVWNVANLCNGSDDGLLNCYVYGAGGGGNSTFWQQPSYQSGPGVLSATTARRPYCSVAAIGQACREVPDVSIDADEYTPYAEYCTGDPSTNSSCVYYPPWSGIGGTSLASPMWSAIAALADSYHHNRLGEASVSLYPLFRKSNAYTLYFHDITGKNQIENSNGLFPTTPNYDEATGIGTPRITALAEALP